MTTNHTAMHGVEHVKLIFAFRNSANAPKNWYPFLVDHINPDESLLNVTASRDVNLYRYKYIVSELSEVSFLPFRYIRNILKTVLK